MTHGALAWSLIALAVSCADGSTERRGVPSGIGSAARALCESIELVSGGDIPAAATAFQDRVHQPLHDLADRLSETDRARAAALLEGKHRVEDALAEGTNVAEVQASMTSLYGELVIAADAVGASAPPCAAVKTS